MPKVEGETDQRQCQGLEQAQSASPAPARPSPDMAAAGKAAVGRGKSSLPALPDSDCPGRSLARGSWRESGEREGYGASAASLQAGRASVIANAPAVGQASGGRDGGQVDGWMDRWMNRWIGEWVDGWTDG